MKKFLLLIALLFTATTASAAMVTDEELNQVENKEITTTSVVEETELSDKDKLKDYTFIYYYGQGCPHCAVLDEYLSKRDIYENANLVKKEVWSNKENAVEMAKVAQSLGVPEGELGVPFFVIVDTAKNERGYLIGDKPVMDFFNQIIWEEIKEAKFPLNDGKNTIKTEGKKNNNLAYIAILVILVAIVLGTVIYNSANKKWKK